MGKIAVAPLVGAWIEIEILSKTYTEQEVAPLVGAWIEISQFFTWTMFRFVAPLVGAWIEMCLLTGCSFQLESLPLWERGLKCTFSYQHLE